jgi:hypothetical protein
MTRTRILAGATALFVITFALIIVAADARQMPAFIKALYAFPAGDKVGHVVMMGALSLLVNATIASRGGGQVRRRMFIATLIITGIVALEELSQQFFAGRTMALDDFASSLIGLWFVGFGGVRWWVRRRERDKRLFDEINEAYDAAP